MVRGDEHMQNLKNLLTNPLDSSWLAGKGCKATHGIGTVLMALAMLLTGLFQPENANAKGGDILTQATDKQVHRQQAVASAVDGLGNLVIAGFRNLTTDTNDDFWTVKMAPDGTVLWRKNYNRNGGSDQATTLIIDANNDVVVTGYVWNGSNNDVYTVKYDGITGDVKWEHTYSGLPGGNEVGSALAFDSTANIVYVGGYVQNEAGNDDFLLLKYDNNATGSNPPLQSATLGGTAEGNDRIASLAFSSNAVAATGTSWNGTDFDVLTAVFETTGNLRWQKRYASTGSYPESGRYVKFDGEGNVLLAATAANPLDFDIYLAKYAAADGALVWQRTYNGSFDDEPMGMVVGSDGDVYLTGYTWTLAGSNDFFTARYNGMTGAVVWEDAYNSAYDYVDIATTTGIVVDDSVNGDVYVTGYTVINGNYDYRTLKYKKESGHLLWQKSYNGPTNRSDRTIGIGLAPNNGVYVVGWSDRTAPVAGETSAATGGTTSTLVNSGKAWTDNQWANYYVKITSGPNRDVERKIITSTATALSVGTEFGAAVTAGDSYYIFDKDDYDLHVITYDRGDLNPATGLTSETVSKAGDGTYTIHLNWEDNSPDETGFIIERKLGEFGSWVEIARVEANMTYYDDAGLPANEYFYYQVKTYRDIEESYPSNDTHSLTFLVTYLTPLWQKAYNGGENMEDYATSIAVGPDDNPVVTGRSDSGLIGMFDFYTFKLNRATGGVLWEERYDSMQNETDMAVCLAVDNNNDIVVSGFSSLYYAPVEGNVHSLFTLKYPSSGPPAVWEKQYNGPAGIDDRATAIASATDGSNIYVVGYGQNLSGNNDIYLVKYLSDGTQQWAIQPIDGGRHDYPVSVALDSQGNIVVTGYRQGARGQVTDLDNFDFYTVKFNSSGQKQWEDSYNPYATGDARAQALATDPAGDIYVAGYVTNDAGNRDYYTIKYYGIDGTRAWTRSYDGPAHGNDWAIGVKFDPVMGSNPLDGNIIVIGTQLSDSADNDSDIHLIRYSTDGELRWERTLIRPHVTDTAEAVAMDSSGYIYVAGDTGNNLNRDIISVIYDYEGTLLGGTTYDGGYGYDQSSSVAVNHQGEAFIAGYTTNSSQNTDYIVVKQKNSYMLVPTPFVAAPQADYSKIVLTWRENTPGTSFRIEKTIGPAHSGSTWNLLTDQASGTTTFTDTGLSANTQYCYRIEAHQGSLPSRKVVTCGTTTLPPPDMTAASNVSPTQLTVNWSNVLGNTGYKIERKIGAGAWEQLPNGILSADTVSFTDVPLTAGTQHTYRVSSKNAGGYSLPSAEKIIWTLPAASALNAPAVVSTTRVDLGWSDVTGETGYRVERKYGTSGSWESLGTKGVGVLTHSDTTASPNTEYFYRIIAYNTSGDAASSAEQRAVMPAAPVTLISAANPAPGTTINLTWNDLTDETAYTIQESRCQYANSNPSYCLSQFANDGYWFAWTTVANPVKDATSYSRTGLLNGYAYRYRIIATVPLSNGSGTNSTAASNLKGAWTWMTAPVLTVLPASETSLALSWNDIYGESTYAIDRKQGQAGTWAQVTTKTSNTLAHTDTGLLLQTEYCYRITASNSYGNSDLTLPPSVSSNEFCLPTPLPAPVLNTPTVPSMTEINLSWPNVTGNTGYEVQRCTLTSYLDTPQSGTTYLNLDGYWSSCTTFILPADTTTYQSTGLSAGYTYRYRVRDLYGISPVYTSAWSTPKAVTTIPPAPNLSSVTANSTTQLTVNWANVYGENNYLLEWKPREGADCSAGTWNGPISVAQNATSYAHTGLTAGTYYCYRIRAANTTWGTSAYSNERSQITMLNAPVLDPLTNVTISSTQLSWANVPGNTGYRISRKVEPTGTYAALASVGQDVTTYPATGLAAGTFYGFKIEALNPGGYSAFSNEQTTTTTPARPTVNPLVLSSSDTELNWSLMKGATNYKVERRPAGESWAEITNLALPYGEAYCGYAAPRVNCSTITPKSTRYLDQGLGSGGTYCYQVKAWNSTGGDSVPSQELCIGMRELVAPVITATPLNSMKIGLDWTYTPGSCSAGPCESPTGYLIEKQNGSGAWQLFLQADAATTSYTDAVGVDPLKTYRYRALAYTGVLDLFDNGISSAIWSQQGVNRNSSGSVINNITIPPIKIVDPTNGNVQISATAGGVLMTTSSPGGGIANSYNQARLNLMNPEAVHGNFDIQVEYRIPEATTSPTQYHVYGRLHVSLPNGAGANYAYVERSTGAYVAYITVEDVQLSGSLATSDMSGKLRLTRHGDRISAYAWSGAKWQLVAEKSGASTGTATGVNFSQYAQRNEAVALKMIIDNVETLSNKSAYSQVSTITTPAYVTADGTCP